MSKPSAPTPWKKKPHSDPIPKAETDRMTTAVDIQSFISKELHSLLFLEEFVFARNKFNPTASSEVELADAVVLLGDVLLIYQIKERSLADAGDTDAERRWFESKVCRKATKQIRNTLHYLQKYPKIDIPNQRGHTFNLAASAATDIIKIVVYMPSRNLPKDCRLIRHHLSTTAGFIHIIDARDYLEVSRTLRVPEEVIRYFKYREAVHRHVNSPNDELSEPVVAGHFIGGDPDKPPTVHSAQYLHQLVQDDDKWDLAPLLRGLHDHLSEPTVSDDYYQIILEFMKLPRSMWRKIKERILLSIEKVRKDEFALPYRLSAPYTDCGFVFIPVKSSYTTRPEWKSIRVGVLEQLTRAHKYDQRLSKCVGIMVAKDDGQHLFLGWCMVSHPWHEDAEIQRALTDSFPFRPVKQAEVYGYLFSED
jgi:hypothetical protein